MLAHTPSVSLPEPTIDAIGHSRQLCDQLKQKIRQKGPITFEQYMHACLYEPGFGYYCAGCTRFGSAGDFITAPSLSPLFGQTIANAISQQLSTRNAHSIVEYGAGEGQLAISVCQQLLKTNIFIQDYYIIDVSPDLKQKQQQLIQEQNFADKISFHWVSEVPSNFNGVILANEVLDAMPVHKVQIKNGHLFEYFVDVEQDEFILVTKPCNNPALLAYAKYYELLSFDNYSTEILLHTKPWLKTIRQQCDQAQIILIDYGFDAATFYHPERAEGTLRCHYRHHAHDDVFYYPSLQDITAHVNFSDVCLAAEELGFKIVNWQSQAEFLIGNGLLTLAEEQFAEVSQDQQYQLSQQVQLLTAPHEMGELFQVLTLATA